MNVLRLNLESGCAIDPRSGYGATPYDVFRIQDRLYARCVLGDHKTVSSNLKTHNLWLAMREQFIEYHKSIGETVIDCKKPRGKNQRREMINAKTKRTLAIRKELIDIGVLKK